MVCVLEFYIVLCNNNNNINNNNSNRLGRRLYTSNGDPILCVVKFQLDSIKISIFVCRRRVKVSCFFPPECCLR